MTSWARRFAVGLFFWIAGAGLLAKLFRAVQLEEEAGADDGLVWLPLGVCSEVLLAALLVAVAYAASRVLPRAAAVAVGVVLGLADIAWLAVNLTSFAITQAPVTFQRLRGDEGVTFADKSLLTFHEVAPSVAFAVLAVALLPAALWAARKIGDRVAPLPAGAVLSVAVLGYSFDAFVTRDENFGVADTPVFTLASSFVHGYVDEHERPPRADGSREGLGELLRARTPVKETPPPPRGRAEMRNVIVIFSEGIARKHTSLDGTDATPNLLRRFHQSGLELTRYYSPYHKSIAAIYSFFCSDFPPPNAQNIVEINPRIDCGEFSDVLSAHGVHTALFHGGQFGFYDKLLLLGMRGYEVMEDSRSMSDPLTYDENEWGIDDRAMVDHLFQWVDDMPPGDRFAATLIPITAHWPYWFPGDVDRPYPRTSSKDDYLSAVHFLDEVFEKLMRGLEARGIAKDTAVIFLADHGETVGERPRASAGRRLAYEPSLHVPFVILAPGMWPGGSQSDELGSHVDLLPTILDLMGFPPDPRHHGRSLLMPDREPQRLFIGASNGPKWVGFIDGHEKFIVNRTTGKREDYDLAADPDERDNRIDRLPKAHVEELTQDALAYADGHLQEIRHAKSRGDEIDIEGHFADSVDVHVRMPDGTLVAPPPGAYKGREVVKAARGHRDCIVVSPPSKGTLELTVSGQAWLPFLTRLRVAETSLRRPTGVDLVPVRIEVDGEPQGRRNATPKHHIRMPFASPEESLFIQVGGNGAAKRDICISVTERGWRYSRVPHPARDDDDDDNHNAPPP